MKGAQANFSAHGIASRLVKPMAVSDTPCARSNGGNALAIKPEGRPCAKYRSASIPRSCRPCSGRAVVRSTVISGRIQRDQKQRETITEKDARGGADEQ